MQTPGDKFMDLQNFKKYLANYPFIINEHEDEELRKFVNYAYTLLNTFFTLDEEFKNSEDFETALFEEAIYLIQNDPTAEYLTKYENLKSFNVAGAISATIIEQYLPYISRFVKKYLEANGYYITISDNSNYGYSYLIY